MILRGWGGRGGRLIGMMADRHDGCSWGNEGYDEGGDEGGDEGDDEGDDEYDDEGGDEGGDKVEWLILRCRD